ncbi:MAG: hypothetical protein ACLFQV_08395 [Vulcanimicrobiota bacterium]
MAAIDLVRRNPEIGRVASQIANPANAVRTATGIVQNPTTRRVIETSMGGALGWLASKLR